MLEAEEKTQFKWEYREDPTKIFPIDYTMEDIANQIGIVRKTLRENLLKSPLLREILLALLFSDDAKEIPDDSKKDKYPIPLESGLFLSELGKLMMENSTYKGIITGKKKASADEEQEFVKQLCQRLCNRISDPNDTSEKAFYRHTLMDNEDFTESVLEDLWEDQFDLRVQRLKEAAKTASIEVQASVLLSCFQALDTGTFQLFSSEQKAEKAKRPQQLTQDLLRALLTVRKKAPRTGSPQIPKNMYAVYSVDNVLVNGIPMKTC